MEFKDRLNAVAKRNTKMRKPPGRGKAWPYEKRLEAVQQYLVFGNMRQVSVLTGIGYDLLRTWKGQPWWAELEREIRASQNIELDTKLSQIVDRSLDAVLDRVENGEYYYDQKSGEVKRRPAALRDVHRVAVDSITKREVIRTGDNQSDTAKLSVEEHLKMLAHEMAKWNKANETKPFVIELEEVEDVEYREFDTPTDSLQEETNRAIYEERETGLQEGSGEIYVETGSSEEEDPAERSPQGSGESGTR